MSLILVYKETYEVVKVLDNANNKLKLSGYKVPERHHIIESGISFYMKRKQTAIKIEKECSRLKKKQEERGTRRS